MIPGYLSGALRDKPSIPAYQWRARTYPQAARAIELAEAQHGEPVPTCLHCGGHITYRHRNPSGECDDCGASPLTAHVDYVRAAPGGPK